MHHLWSHFHWCDVARIFALLAVADNSLKRADIDKHEKLSRPDSIEDFQLEKKDGNGPGPNYKLQVCSQVYHYVTTFIFLPLGIEN